MWARKATAYVALAIQWSVWASGCLKKFPESLLSICVSPHDGGMLNSPILPCVSSHSEEDSQEHGMGRRARERKHY